MPFFFALFGTGLAEKYHAWLDGLGLAPDDRLLLNRVIGLAALGLLSWLLAKIVRRVMVFILDRMVPREPSKIVHLLYNARVLRKTAALTPIVVIVTLAPVFFPEDDAVRSLLRTAVELYTVVVVVWISNAGLSAFYQEFNGTALAGHIGLQAFIQAIKLVIIITGILLGLSILVGQSPIYFLSGLGAATAILLLVFKDVILGLVAGVQITVNDMVRVGDWMQMDSQNANGTVTEISLTNVKVSNFDKTVTSIPTYALISQSFINWRGMFDSGGRRIKQSMHIDLRTVHYAEKELIERLQKVDILKDWLASRLQEIRQENEAKGADAAHNALNGRRLTNLGLFRRYTVEYLKACPRVYTDGSFIFLVRYLEAQGQGLPMQIYVFTRTTVWAEYEDIMADIFDHLYAAAPLFGLRVFQSPSGNDLATLGHASGDSAHLKGAAAAVASPDRPQG